MRLKIKRTMYVKIGKKQQIKAILADLIIIFAN